MPCYHPIRGFRSKHPNAKGKFPVKFKYDQQTCGEEIQIGCGQCIGCRLETSRQWAMRCIQEATLHEENSYITLTYNDENIPAYNTLSRREWQLFMKKLRKHVEPKKIRFKMCGEYGQDQTNNSTRNVGRPHFHALIFGHQFKDLEFYSEYQGNRLYTSETLSNLWGKGFVTVGEVTFDSAAYVARYIMKKINGKLAEEHYETICHETGEVRQLMPEFTGQSNRPGIGADWFHQYKHDLDKGFITVKGVKMPAPKYYHKLYEETDPENYAPIKQARLDAIDLDDPNNTASRLAVREKLRRKKTKALERQL